MLVEISKEYIDKLIKEAKRDRWDDDVDFNPYEYSGGNYDDAYYGGVDDGEIISARNFLDELGIKWQ